MKNDTILLLIFTFCIQLPWWWWWGSVFVCVREWERVRKVHVRPRAHSLSLARFVNISFYTHRWKCYKWIFYLFLLFRFFFVLLRTGTVIWYDGLHAHQQYICIHFAQDISNFNAYRSPVRCLMDMCRRLLFWHSLQHFHTGRNKREKPKWTLTKNHIN